MVLAIAVTFLAIASNLLIADGTASMSDSKNYDANNDVPESCKNQEFCTSKPDDYPQEKIDNILDDHKATLRPAPVDELLQQLQFLNDEGYDVINCPSQVTFEPLYKVKQKGGSWRTVIQSHDYDFVQRVRLETCTNPGGSCSRDYDPAGIDASCNQKFTTVELVVMKGDNETETISVMLPSECGVAVTCRDRS